MDACFRCKKSGSEVRLLDAISDANVVKMCEECSAIEGVPVIKRPSTSQLKESEKPYRVTARLRRMAGLNPEEDEVSKIAKKMMDVSLDDLRERKK